MMQHLKIHSLHELWHQGMQTPPWHLLWLCHPTAIFPISSLNSHLLFTSAVYCLGIILDTSIFCIFRPAYHDPRHVTCIYQCLDSAFATILIHDLNSLLQSLPDSSQCSMQLPTLLRRSTSPHPQTAQLAPHPLGNTVQNFLCCLNRLPLVCSKLLHTPCLSTHVPVL